MPGNETGDLQGVSLPDGKLLREPAQLIPALGEVIAAGGDALVLEHIPVVPETTRAGGDGQAIRLPREPATRQHRRWPVLRLRILCLLHQCVERQQGATGRQGGRGGPEDRRIGRVPGGNACQQHFVERLLARATLRFGDRDARVVLLEIPGDSVQSRAEVSPTARRPEGHGDLLPLPAGVEEVPHAARQAVPPPQPSQRRNARRSIACQHTPWFLRLMTGSPCVQSRLHRQSPLRPSRPCSCSSHRMWSVARSPAPKPAQG